MRFRRMGNGSCLEVATRQSGCGMHTPEPHCAQPLGYKFGTGTSGESAVESLQHPSQREGLCQCISEMKKGQNLYYCFDPHKRRVDEKAGGTRQDFFVAGSVNKTISCITHIAETGLFHGNLPQNNLFSTLPPALLLFRRPSLGGPKQYQFCVPNDEATAPIANKNNKCYV